MNCLFKNWKNVLKYFSYSNLLACRLPVLVVRRWRKLLSTMIAHLLDEKSRSLFHSRMTHVITLSKDENPGHFDQFLVKNDHATTPSWTATLIQSSLVLFFWLIVMSVLFGWLLFWFVVVVVTTDAVVFVLLCLVVVVSATMVLSSTSSSSVEVVVAPLVFVVVVVVLVLNA